MNIITDARHMLSSIDQAIGGMEKSPANYGGQVGAVLVGSSGEVLAEAYNHLVGGERKHAEEIILGRVSSGLMKGSTLYVTVEPCNGNPYHDRRHCCEQIADSGIGRVVIGVRKTTFEGGVEYMLKHGVEVEKIENDNIKRLCDLLKSPNIDSPVSEKTMKKIYNLRANLNNL